MDRDRELCTKALIYGLFQKGRVLAQDGEFEIGKQGIALEEQGIKITRSPMRPPRNPLASWSLSLISRDAVLSAMPVGLTTRSLTFRDVSVCTPTSLLMAMAFADTPGPTDTSIQIPLPRRPRTSQGWIGVLMTEHSSFPWRSKRRRVYPKRSG